MQVPKRLFARVPSGALPMGATWLLGLLLGSSLGACTDPRFRDLDAAGNQWDAGADGAFTLEDSAVAPADGAAAWAAKLVGRYGVRIRFYSVGNLDGSKFAHEIMMLADITQDSSGHVNMEVQRCEDTGYALSGTVPGGIQNFSWPRAAYMPKENFELVMTDGKFHTVPAAHALGYLETQPAGCESGGTLSAGNARPWLSGSPCTCRPERLPPTPDDCRITDPDQDGAPGISVSHTGLYKGTNTVRVEDSCQIVGGSVRADKHHEANYLESYDYHEIQCSAIACADGSVAGCMPTFNPVEFEPLDGLPAPGGDAWDCTGLLEQTNTGKLFSSDKFEFPPACASAK